MSEPIIKTENLSKIFEIKEGNFFQKKKHLVYAVNNVSLSVAEGEVLGIVGESGSGKTTLGKLLIKLIQPSSGKIFLNKIDVSDLSISSFRKHRSIIQMVFQNPYSSLNPSMQIGEQLQEAVVIAHNGNSSKVDFEQLQKIVHAVDLNEDVLTQYPHQLSGGEARRIGLARILAVEPQVIILDEPVASLDLSIRSNVITLLMQIKKERGLSYIWISHDFEVIRHVADRVVVMFGGRIVEIFNPRNEKVKHPYTKILLDSADKIAGGYSGWTDSEDLNRALFDSSTEINGQRGCVYFPFCKKYKELEQPALCVEQTPLLQKSQNEKEQISCHFIDL